LTPQHRRDRPFGLGCGPFARRYLGYHVCFLFLRVLRCFSSPRALPAVLRDDRSLHLPGCPIRKSMDHCALAAPHRVSPLGTSFIGTLPLGIPQKPCLTLNAYPLHTHSLPPPRRPIDPRDENEKPRATDGQSFQYSYRAKNSGSQKTYERRCYSLLQTVKRPYLHRRLITVDVCTMSAQFTVFRCQSS
jgi:hypothetical protein